MALEHLSIIQHAETGHIDNPRIYLYRITHNLSADYYHQKQVRARHVGDEEESDIIAGPQPGPEATIDAELRLQLCLNVLYVLPEVYQHVFASFRRLDLCRNRPGPEFADPHGRTLCGEGARRYLVEALENQRSFPTGDIDLTLNTIAAGLQVKVVRRETGHVVLEPAKGPSRR